MYREYLLGKYFKISTNSYWKVIETPSICIDLERHKGVGCVGFRFLGWTVHLWHYSNGDSKIYTSDYDEVYEEDYCQDCIESESDYCDNCVDHVELLTKDNVALRDIVG